MAAYAEEAFDITVRSTVDAPQGFFSKPAPVVHSKFYSIGGIRAAFAIKGDTSSPLAIAVDEDNLHQELRKVLAARGFVEATGGKLSDIVLTVVYGKDKMKNPYNDKSLELGAAAAEGYGFHGIKVVSASVDELHRERTEVNYREKMEKADQAKLFVIISAWQQPGFYVKDRDHAKLLWRTVVYVDDPDQDLNAIAGKMLAAASAYFDRTIPQEEIALSSKAIPEGTVAVGAPVEVDSDKK